MSVFALKIIAIISMLLDHIKFVIPETNCFVTEYFGRIAFPIFAFLVSEGFVHTRSKWKYMLRMLVFAVISQLPFHLVIHIIVHSKANFNVMFTFEIALIGLLIIDFFKNDKTLSKFLRYLVIMASLAMILIITYYLHPEYSWFGVSCVWAFYIFRDKKILKSITFILLVFAYYFSYKQLTNYTMILFNIIPLILILFYNGKQGRKLKYFFYIFYPTQFLILYLISLIH